MADEDNGNLLDGTPHMQAIFDAFDRHHIACSTLTLQDSGLQDGREYSYVVAAFGSTDACMGPTSLCASVIPGVLPLFADGFESGTTGGWDGTVGGI